jgi:hypothetical protein
MCLIGGPDPGRHDINALQTQQRLDQELHPAAPERRDANTKFP